MEIIPYTTAKMHDEIIAELNPSSKGTILIIAGIAGIFVIGYFVISVIKKNNKKEKTALQKAPRNDNTTLPDPNESLQAITTSPIKKEG